MGSIGPLMRVHAPHAAPPSAATYSAQVEHGFHAFFRQYYNLTRFLERLRADRFMKPISDYAIDAEVVYRKTIDFLVDSLIIE